MSKLRDILAAEGLLKRANLTVREFEGEEGDKGHLTRVEEGEVRLLNIMRLKGSRGEKREWQRRGDQWFFGNYTEADWKAFLEDIRVNGIKEPIFITKDWGQEAVISEGNHRLQAAIQLRLRKVPVEIRYFGHSERQGLVGR